ncbi:transcription factor CBF/NF-Y domain-containing protein [Chloropicon primus]|uniref:Transcription factor CBF/NF-Y/archaeal histone domain-containing protein n=1 Tax=Chloropicon primus TaxID=1764295 RepID=A0A5B8MGL5_9CHLO|nr:hypothetical protein A3770_03p23360 [Chloropicon primus]UPQ99028.1 transcription factor CBF/NF-Y domain-containing protein [Chloropicon primus]|mmetsp:Transcript_9289/g.26422  ORF Transcript_9289/g.26422 Transcript_9289/m.26422 type:complete len:186 (+) Transcript_9289:263-820(+)|eukprot:QDZ19818.1 hypothetical protein A3770_03p23360 [Chloropicon primus]
MDTDADLPRSNVRRIVKQKITELKGTGGPDIHLNRDALTALSEACRVFIHLISATANDICVESKRQTISVGDVISALEDLEFGDLIAELEGDIEDHRSEMRERAKKRSESIKKRKAQKAAEELASETKKGEGGEETTTDGNGVPVAAAAGEDRAKEGEAAHGGIEAGKPVLANTPAGAGAEPMAE